MPNQTASSRVRRHLLALASALALVIGLSACTSDPEPSSANSGSASADASAFPVTLEHKYGKTTIPSAPKRVAVVGYNDQDYVLAFGMTPVMVRDWAGQSGIPEYAKKYVTGPEPALVDLGNDAINAEKVAEYKPDLIVGVYSGMTQADYDALSKIAPTIAQLGQFKDYQEPWQDVTKQIGAALGQPKEAEQLIADTQAKFDAAKAANPQWKGKTIVDATYSDNTLSAFATGDSRSRFLSDLGFTVNPAIDTLAGEKFYATIPTENAGLYLNTDVIVWDQLSYTSGGKATIQGLPALAALPAMQAGHEVWLEPQSVEAAFGWQTILSIPVAIDALVPLLAKAVPAT